MIRFVLPTCLVLLSIGCGERAQPAAEPQPEKVAKPVAIKHGPLLAGAAKIEITDPKARAADPLYVKALVLKNDVATAVFVTVDAVAIGEIGPIGNDYLGKVRAKIERELKIAPECVIVNASHCHGLVCADVDEKTYEAVRKAKENMVPVKVGAGRGREDRISENRRMKLKNGQVVDVRHAYSMPPDDEVAEIGPIDPEIGLLKLDRFDGTTLAVVYNFACHPIMGMPDGGNTADLVGYASKAIEDNLSDGAIALFVQGCGGDINPALYKEVHLPRSAEPLGNRLGLSALRAIRKIQCADGGPLVVMREIAQFPRADNTERIIAQEAALSRLVKSLKGTTLNLKSFLQLAAKYNLSKEFPAYYAHRYAHEKSTGREDLSKLDDDNRKNLAAYVDNILTMEQITRVQANLALLKKHQERNLAAGRKPLPAELVALRVGEFVLVTFPGELTVEIGLNVKKTSPHRTTFVAGYTNGYIYYTPTAKQLGNSGVAQEDCDCLVAPEWEAIYYKMVAAMLKKLNSP